MIMRPAEIPFRHQTTGLDRVDSGDTEDIEARRGVLRPRVPPHRPARKLQQRPVMKLLALVVLLATAYSPAQALWPQPQSVQIGSSTLRLAPGFQITVVGRGVPGDLLAAVGRTKQLLRGDKLERLVVGRGAADAHTFDEAKFLSRLTLSLEKGVSFKTITSEAQKAPEERDEAYHLVVPADGSGASITANSTLGLLRGLTTFSQLWYEHSNTIYTVSAPVTIQDKPAYVSTLYLYIA